MAKGGFILEDKQGNAIFAHGGYNAGNQFERGEPKPLSADQKVEWAAMKRREKQEQIEKDAYQSRLDRTRYAEYEMYLQNNKSGGNNFSRQEDIDRGALAKADYHHFEGTKMLLADLVRHEYEIGIQNENHSEIGLNR